MAIKKITKLSVLTLALAGTQSNAETISYQLDQSSDLAKDQSERPLMTVGSIGRDEVFFRRLHQKKTCFLLKMDDLGRQRNCYRLGSTVIVSFIEIKSISLKFYCCVLIKT